MSDYILSGMSVSDLERKANEIKAIYDEYGIVIFPSILENDNAFQKFHTELGFIFDEVLARHSKSAIPKDLGDKLVKLNSLSPLDGKILTDLGTQPNKFNSFNLIKYSAWMEKVYLSYSASWGHLTPFCSWRSVSSIQFTPASGLSIFNAIAGPGNVLHRTK